MITLTLLHPVQSIPIQTWTFSGKDVISIGRAPDNNVVLYSAVVSRRHAELRRNGDIWELTNLGTNGTYLNGKRVQQSIVANGSVLRLARSGPNLKIQFPGEPSVGLENAATASPSPPDPSLLQVTPDYSPPDQNTQEHYGDVDRGPEAKAKQVANRSCTHQRTAANSLFCPDCGQPTQVQQIIRGYQVVRVLGRGGMGTTYLTWKDDQIRVLKEINADLVDNPKAQQLFEREAHTLQQLNHPGVPRFFDFFTEAGKRYLVMEMIYGQDLERWVLQKGPVSSQQAIDWMVQACEVLDYLHSRETPIIHRDIKPGNLLSRVGTQQLVVLDFGAVRAMKSPALGTRIGAEGYSAPEQDRGRPVLQSDLYSVGSTLVYLLTGSGPSRFYRQIQGNVRLWLDGQPEATRIKPELRSVIMRVTDPLPEKRYTTARDLAAALLGCVRTPSLQA
ncbi:protein kinase [Leptolyngbya sp. FACHB-261]|nr:protein kinase [Leptolyngbya sp. FACHB-261]